MNFALFQDWENLFFVDPDIISDGVEFMLRYQTEEGGFSEAFEHPEILRMDLHVSKSLYLSQVETKFTEDNCFPFDSDNSDFDQV